MRIFAQSFIDGDGKTAKELSVLFSLVLQIIAIAILILIPIVYTAGLPSVELKSALLAPAPPPPPVPRAMAKRSVSVIHRFAPELIAPRVIPPQVNNVTEDLHAPDVAAPAEAGASNGIENSIASDLFSPKIVSAPPVPAAKPKAPAAPVRIGGNVAAANLIRSVQPVYPALARSARIEGTVEFTAVIGKNGSIEDLQLVRGHPLLVNAAKQAVLQWKYRPTLLNGQPVEVLTDITVKFVLSH